MNRQKLHPLRWLAAIAVAATGFAALPAQAHTDVAVGVTLGAPGYYAPPRWYGPTVIYEEPAYDYGPRVVYERRYCPPRGYYYGRHYGPRGYGHRWRGDDDDWDD